MSINFLDYFVAQAQIDVVEATEEAFSNGFSICFRSVPKPVHDTNRIYHQLIESNNDTDQNIEILKTALIRYLNISKQHASFYSHPDPDGEELMEIMFQQEKSVICWNKFIELYYAWNDLILADVLAFQDASIYQKPIFDSEEAKRLYSAQIKNQQQEFVGGKNINPVYALDKHLIEPKLTPTLDRLYDLLITQEPRSLKYLLIELLGCNVIHTEKRKNLIKRISDLNAILTKTFGPSPNQKWIQLVIMSRGEEGYQLLKSKREF